MRLDHRMRMIGGRPQGNKERGFGPSFCLSQLRQCNYEEVLLTIDMREGINQAKHMEVLMSLAESILNGLVAAAAAQAEADETAAARREASIVESMIRRESALMEKEVREHLIHLAKFSKMDKVDRSVDLWILQKGSKPWDLISVLNTALRRGFPPLKGKAIADFFGMTFDVSYGRARVW